jgi:hypothetical protein
MRLLSREDGRLRLIEFADDKVPAYAILSHTWGAAGEEIIFKDLTDGAIEVPAEGSDKSKGFSKLQFCADQAVRDGLEYFWVDTCCIDRSDTIEVQHAVNSMFRWYGNAVKCYVYLSDVDSSDHQDSWRSEFLASRWFTRGWTLQELLAPKSVEFFSKRGDRLGDKASLEAQILEITKVPAKALRGAPVSQFTVEERMSWIKDRQTKYAEDKAYALQGLFEVYMPVIYGEGEKNAFRRLRQEIQHSSLPQIGPPSPSSTVPFRRDQSFLDRDILAKIRQKCSLPAARVALVGLGGVGYDPRKSALRIRPLTSVENRNLPLNGHTEFEMSLQRHGCSGSMLDLWPGSRKDIALSRIERKYLTGKTRKPTFFNSLAIGSATRPTAAGS